MTVSLTSLFTLGLLSDPWELDVLETAIMASLSSFRLLLASLPSPGSSEDYTRATKEEKEKRFSVESGITLVKHCNAGWLAFKCQTIFSAIKANQLACVAECFPALCTDYKVSALRYGWLTWVSACKCEITQSCKIIQSFDGVLTQIIFRCIFSFLFIGREITTWPANNCLQKGVLLQMILCSCVTETTLLYENGGSVEKPNIYCQKPLKQQRTLFLSALVVFSFSYSTTFDFLSTLSGLWRDTAIKHS